MSAVRFADLPDSARVWIFGSARPLAEPETAALEAAMQDFLENWRAHGRPVVGAGEIRHDRFLLIGADEEASGVSGCSIDALFRALQGLENEHGIALLDSSPVWFRGRRGEVQVATRAEFRELARAGTVDGATVVFDNTIGSVGEIRRGRWEGPARSSWHGRAYGLVPGER